MKLLIVSALLALGSIAMAGDVYVPGGIDSNGNYRPGYHRTTPDKSPWNNYGTEGHYNPWTGKAGTVNPNRPPRNPYTPRYPR